MVSVGKRRVSEQGSGRRVATCARAVRQLRKLLVVLLAAGGLATSAPAQQRAESYVVRLRDDAVIPYLVRQLAASQAAGERPQSQRALLPAARRRVNPRSSEAAQYRATLAAQQAVARRRIEGLLGAEVRAQIATVFNGLEYFNN